MPDEVTELTQAEARAAFLANPPEIVSEPNPAPVLDDEGAALDELTRPPAAGEAAPESGAVPAGTAAGSSDPFAEYGGKDAVANAMELDRALRTEQGVKLVIRQGLEALGYTDAQIRAALGGGAGLPVASSDAPAAAEPSDPFAGIEDDDVVTGGDVKRLLAQVRDQAVAQAQAVAAAQLEPIAAQAAAQAAAAQAARNDSTLVEALGPIPTDPGELATYQALAREVMAAAHNYVRPEDTDPAVIRAGIIKAHADIEAHNEARWNAYLAQKKKNRDSAPANIGGHTAGETPEAEPQNMAEARAAARAAGLFN